jgi:hypothetical protein
MALILPALVNGKSYENADIACNIMGVVIAGIQAINYDDPQDITGVFGAGRKQVSYGNGQIKPTGSITLLMEEVENIVSIAPLGRIQDIPFFNITVSWIDANLLLVTHKLTNCRFKNYKIDTKTGDTSTPCTIDLFIGDIIRN